MMETVELKRDCNAIAIPSGSRQVLPGGTRVRIVQVRASNYTVSSEIHAMFRIDAADADALGQDSPAASKDQVPSGPLEEGTVWAALRTIYDPEIPVNIVDLGLVYSCMISPHPEGGKTVAVRMAMTSPGCGMSDVLKADAEGKLSRLPDVREAHVEVVFDPPWTPDRMSEGARLALGMDPGGGGGTDRLVRIS
jgi:probable FeS assembly SUF system protein SufT